MTAVVGKTVPKGCQTGTKGLLAYKTHTIVERGQRTCEVPHPGMDDW